MAFFRCFGVVKSLPVNSYSGITISLSVNAVSHHIDSLIITDRASGRPLVCHTVGQLPGHGMRA